MKIKKEKKTNKTKKKSDEKIVEDAFSRVFYILGFPYPVPPVCPPLEETVAHFTKKEKEALDRLSK